MITVLIPNRNHGAYLARCLQGLLPNFDEIRVIDDASEDNSRDIVRLFQVRHPQLRLIEKDKPRGLLANLNEEVARLSSGHVLFHAADDYLLPGAFSRLRKILQDYPKVGVVVWDLAFESSGRARPPHRYLPRKGSGYFPPDQVAERFRGLPFVGQALFRVDALREIGGQPEALAWHADHHTAWVLGLRHGVYYLNETLGVLQENPDSYSSGMFGERQRDVLVATIREWNQPKYEDVRKGLIRGLAFAVFPGHLLRDLLRVQGGEVYWTPELRRFLWLGKLRHRFRHPLPTKWKQRLKKLWPRNAMNWRSHLRRPLLRLYRKILLATGWGNVPLGIADSTPAHLKGSPAAGSVIWQGIRSLPPVPFSPSPGLPHPNLSHARPGAEAVVWVADMEKAEVNGPSVAVTTADRILLADVSIEWNKIPEDHGVMRRFRLPAARRLKGTSVLLGSTGGDTYHHWMMDVLPRMDLLQAAGTELAAADHFLVNGREKPFQRDSLIRLGIPLEKCVAMAGRCRFSCDTLLLPSLPFPTSRPSREACEFLRRSFAVPEAGTPRRLLIGRGGGLSRQVGRWDEIRQRLQPLGFSDFDPGSFSLEEQVRAFASAEMVVGVHGAALTNLVFCRPGIPVVEIFGSGYVNPCYRNLCAAAGLRHFGVVDATPAGQAPRLDLIDPQGQIEGDPEAVLHLASEVLAGRH